MKFTALALGLTALTIVSAKDAHNFGWGYPAACHDPYKCPFNDWSDSKRSRYNYDPSNPRYDPFKNPTLHAATANMVFDLTIEDFSMLFKRRHLLGRFFRTDAERREISNLVDWTSDACTRAADRPLGWDFKPACKRHDFGHRNYMRQGRYTKSAKKAIDHKFKKDMIAQCSHENGSHSACRTMAKIYAKVAKHAGKKRDLLSTERNPLIPLPHPSALFSPLPLIIGADAETGSDIEAGTSNTVSSNMNVALPVLPSGIGFPMPGPVLPSSVPNTHWLLDVVDVNPALLHNLSAEEARSLESLVDAEMDEQERDAWFVAEWEVLGTPSTTPAQEGIVGIVKRKAASWSPYPVCQVLGGCAEEDDRMKTWVAEKRMALEEKKMALQEKKNKWEMKCGGKICV